MKQKKLLKKDLPSKRVDSIENIIFYFENFTEHKFMLYEGKQKCDGKVVQQKTLFDELSQVKIFKDNVSQTTLDKAISELCNKNKQTKESIKQEKRNEMLEIAKTKLQEWLGDKYFAIDKFRNIFNCYNDGDEVITHQFKNEEIEILRNKIASMCSFEINKTDFKTILFGMAMQNEIDNTILQHESKYIDVITDESINSNNYSEFYKLDKHGVPVTSINNYCLFLKHSPEFENKIRLNLFDKGVYYGNTELSDSTDGKIKRIIEQEFSGVDSSQNINRQNYKDAISDVAASNLFHPIKDMLNGLIGKWDGKERLATCFIDLMQADDTRLNRNITTKWFVAAIKRIMEEPEFGTMNATVPMFDHILILYGGQGCGKSKFFPEVFGKQYCNSKINVKIMFDSPQNGLPAWNKCWIGIFDEMAGLNYNDTQMFKNFVTTDSFVGTMKYKETATTFYTHQVYCGSTNEQYFLNDDSGERRMWIIDVHGGQKDPSWWKENFTAYYKEQLLAEAMNIYINNPDFDINYLDKEDEAALDIVIKSHKTLKVHNLEDEACGYIANCYVVKSNDMFNDITEFKEMTTIEGDDKFDTYQNKHKLYIIRAKTVQDYVGDFAGKKIPYAKNLVKFFENYGWSLKQWQSKKRHPEHYNKMVFVKDDYYDGKIDDKNDETNVLLYDKNVTNSTNLNGELPF